MTSETKAQERTVSIDGRVEVLDPKDLKDKMWTLQRKGCTIQIHENGDISTSGNVLGTTITTSGNNVEIHDNKPEIITQGGSVFMGSVIADDGDVTGVTFGNVGVTYGTVVMNIGDDHDDQRDQQREALEARLEREQEAREREQEALHDRLEREQEAREREQEARERAQEALRDRLEREQEARERAQEALQARLEREQEARERAHEARQRAHEAQQRAHEARQRTLQREFGKAFQGGAWGGW